jgi:hypothetical protein
MKPVISLAQLKMEKKKKELKKNLKMENVFREGNVKKLRSVWSVVKAW